MFGSQEGTRTCGCHSACSNSSSGNARNAQNGISSRAQSEAASSRTSSKVSKLVSSASRSSWAVSYTHLSYTWKAQIAFYEKEVAHEFRAIETEPPFTHYDELRAHWPVGQFPLIVDDGRPLFEASIIAEYLDQRSDAGPRLIPADPQAALEVRFLDRISDNHFQARFQAAVAEYLPFITETPDLARVARARDQLEQVYGWLETCLLYTSRCV